MTAFTESKLAYCQVTFFNSPTAGDIWLLPGSAAAPDSMTLILLTANGQPGPTIYGASPKTAKGIGLGSTLTELQEAYPGIAQTEIAPGDSTFHAYAVTQNGNSWIVFELDPDSKSDSGHLHLSHAARAIGGLWLIGCSNAQSSITSAHKEVRH
jgi:hypothetical protein